MTQQTLLILGFPKKTIVEKLLILALTSPLSELDRGENDVIAH